MNTTPISPVAHPLNPFDDILLWGDESNEYSYYPWSNGGSDSYLPDIDVRHMHAFTCVEQSRHYDNTLDKDQLFVLPRCEELRETNPMFSQAETPRSDLYSASYFRDTQRVEGSASAFFTVPEHETCEYHNINVDVSTEYSFMDSSKLEMALSSCYGTSILKRIAVYGGESVINALRCTCRNMMCLSSIPPYPITNDGINVYVAFLLEQPSMYQIKHHSILL